MSLITEVKLIDTPDEKSQLKNIDLDLHDYLTDNADWDVEYWDFETSYLEEYSKKLKTLFDISNNGIEFQALWAGEKPQGTIEYSIEEFLTLVKNNKISTKYRYIVSKSA